MVGMLAAMMPVNLISQWIRSIEQIAPKAFTIWKYYGDARKNNPIACEKMIQGRRHKKHEVFDNNAAPFSTIIMSSYSTWSKRHGPQAQRRWLTNKKKLWRTNADRVADDLQPGFEGSLDGCFDAVILDEGHVVKSLQAKGSLSVSWLHAQKYFLQGTGRSLAAKIAGQIQNQCLYINKASSVQAIKEPLSTSGQTLIG